MSDSVVRAGRTPVILAPGQGRSYPMGRLLAVFKADGAQTGRGYSISEWWLDPHTRGPGPHSHLEDDVFYVLAGVVSVLVDAAIPGSFEDKMPGIAQWFIERTPADSQA